jgi:hypothetical protein
MAVCAGQQATEVVRDNRAAEGAPVAYDPRRDDQRQGRKRNGCVAQGGAAQRPHERDHEQRVEQQRLRASEDREPDRAAEQSRGQRPGAVAEPIGGEQS